MAKFSKLEVLQTIKDSGIVPVFYHKDPKTAANVARACHDGGIRVFEFTNRGDFAHEVFAKLNKYALEELPDMIIGAGSVVDAATAALYIQLGANFIVGPCFNPEVAVLCNRRCIPYAPGCGSITEVGTAQQAGCDLVKIFPGDVLGPAFVKALLGPMPWSKVLITGGVKPNKENLEGWFKAGAFAVGMGSNLFPKEAINSENWASITALCKESLTIIKNCK